MIAIWTGDDRLVPIPDSQITKIQALMRTFIGLRNKGRMGLRGFVSFLYSADGLAADSVSISGRCCFLRAVSPRGEMGRIN